MIIHRRPLDVLEMIVGRSPHEVRNGFLGQELCPHVERLDSQGIIFVLAGGKGQIAVSRAQVGFQFHGRQKFLLRLGKLLLFEQSFAQSLVECGFVGIRGQQCPIRRVRLIVFLGYGIQISKIALQRNIGGSELNPSLQFGDRVFVLALCRQHSSQLNARGGLVGMRCD